MHVAKAGYTGRLRVGIDPKYGDAPAYVQRAIIRSISAAAVLRGAEVVMAGSHDVDRVDVVIALVEPTEHDAATAMAEYAIAVNRGLRAYRGALPAKVMVESSVDETQVFNVTTPPGGAPSPVMIASPPTGEPSSVTIVTPPESPVPRLRLINGGLAPDVQKRAAGKDAIKNALFFIERLVESARERGSEGDVAAVDRGVTERLAQLMARIEKALAEFDGANAERATRLILEATAELREFSKYIEHPTLALMKAGERADDTIWWETSVVRALAHIDAYAKEALIALGVTP